MRPLTTELLIHLLTDALTHEADLQHPRLLPFLADFHASLQRLVSSGGPGLSKDEQLAALRDTARQADHAHDDAFQAFHHALLAVGLRLEDPQARTTVQRGVDVLFPHGFGFLAATFAAEAGAAETFAQRLHTPEAQSALQVVAVEVPHIHTWAQRCVDAGRTLGHATAAVDAHVGEVALQGPSAAADRTPARNEARSLWRAYLEAIDRTYPAKDPQSAGPRSRLLAVWQHVGLGEVPATVALPVVEPVLA